MKEKRKRSFSKDDERKIAAYTEKVKHADLVEDIKFREIAKSKEAVQEILRVVLDDEKLVVVRSIEQKNISESVFHVVSNNGIRELYVNLTAEVKDNKLKALFDILKELNYINNQMFPNLSKTKEKFNNMMEGEKQMSGLTREIYIDGYESGEKKGIEQGIEQGMQQGIEQGKLSILVNLVKDKLLSVDEAAKRLGVSEAEFAKLANA